MILKGVKVIEMGHVVAVPATCAILADWGADVVKIEPPYGEMMRGFKKIQGVDSTIKLDGDELHWNFQLLNRNKRGLAVDLKKVQGRGILYNLIQECDIFISNYELSSIKKLNMDYDTLCMFNPTLIYGVLTGYGTVGPDKDERGFDLAAAWARSGTQYLMGEPNSPPPPQRGGMMDMTVAAHIVSGILAALLHRERTGKGQKIEFSLYHTAVWTLGEDIQAALVGMPLPRQDRTKVSNPLFNNYKTKDDKWLQLVMIQSDIQWSGFCRAIGKPDIEDDPRFNSMEMRQEHNGELICLLDRVFASKDRDAWEVCLKEHNCIYGRVASPTEVVNDPQAISNKFFAPIQGMEVVTSPVKFCQNPALVRSPAPKVGEHTEEILLNLGYSWDDISQLKNKGVIL